MRKFLTRALGIAAVAVGFAFAGAGMASADTALMPPPPSYQEQQAIFIDGGENAGKGAAQLVSAAFAGPFVGAVQLGEEIGNYGASYFPGIR